MRCRSQRSQRALGRLRRRLGQRLAVGRVAGDAQAQLAARQQPAIVGSTGRGARGQRCGSPFPRASAAPALPDQQDREFVAAQPRHHVVRAHPAGAGAGPWRPAPRRRPARPCRSFTRSEAVQVRPASARTAGLRAATRCPRLSKPARLVAPVSASVPMAPIDLLLRARPRALFSASQPHWPMRAPTAAASSYQLRDHRRPARSSLRRGARAAPSPDPTSGARSRCRPAAAAAPVPGTAPPATAGAATHRHRARRQHHRRGHHQRLHRAQRPRQALRRSRAA
jgi:hypothetical protein